MVGLLPRLVKDTEQRLVEDDFHESPALARHCVQRLVAFTLRFITPLFHDFGVELDVVMSVQMPLPAARGTGNRRTGSGWRTGDHTRCKREDDSIVIQADM